MRRRHRRGQARFSLFSLVRVPGPSPGYAEVGAISVHKFHLVRTHKRLRSCFCCIGPYEMCQAPTSKADECPPPTLPLCRHYLRGLCLYGDQCRFVHCLKAAAAARATAEPTAEEAARQHAIDAATLLYQQTERTLCKLRQSGARPASSAPMRDALAQLTRHRERCKTLRASGGMPTGQRLSRYATRLRVRNSERAGALRRFLIETYGLHALAAGGGVVDVAGGQASLTCNFRSCHTPFPPLITAICCSNLTSRVRWPSSFSI